jgi:hypothetical protein
MAFVFLALPSSLMGQSIGDGGMSPEDQPAVTSDVNAAKVPPISLTMYPLVTTGMPPEGTPGTMDSSIITADMLKAIGALSSPSFTVNSLSQFPPGFNPDVPPDAGAGGGTDYSLTEALFYDAQNYQTQCQVWLYDNTTGKLVITDQIVFPLVTSGTSAEDTQNDEQDTMPPFIAYILGQIHVKPILIQKTRTRTRTVRVSQRSLNFVHSKNDWYIGFSYAPAFTLIGRQSWLFSQTCYPEGFDLQGGFYPFQFSWGKLGFFVRGNFSQLNGKKKSTYTWGSLYLIGGGLSYQAPKLFSSRNGLFFMQPEVSLDGGLSFVTGKGMIAADSAYGTGGPDRITFFGGVVDVRFFEYWQFYISAGLGFDLLLPANLADKVLLLRPVLSLGWHL